MTPSLRRFPRYRELIAYIEEILSQPDCMRHYAQQELYRARAELDAIVAREFGWVIARRRFRVSQLLRQTPSKRVREPDDPQSPSPGLIDHATWFREPGTRRAAAILTQHYYPPAVIHASAHAAGARTLELPDSWWYPGRTTAVLLLPPEPQPHRTEGDAPDDAIW